MKKIEREMTLMMGTVLSFCLSLFGTITSGQFSIPSFLVSFVLSLILSFIIGMIIPLKGITDKVTGSMWLEKGKLSTRAVEAIVSDIIFTPIITFAMILLAYKMSHGNMPFVPVFVKSLLLSLLVGFVIIFIITTPILRFVLKKNGVQMGGPQGGPPQKGPENNG